MELRERVAARGAPAVGVVFNPVMNEMFTAVRGGGARLNGEVIRCSETEALGRSLIGTEIGGIETRRRWTR